MDPLKGLLCCLVHSSGGWYRGRIKLALSSARSVPGPAACCSTTYPDPFLKELGKREQKTLLCLFCIHSLEVNCRPTTCKTLSFTMRVTEKYDIWSLFLGGHLCSCASCPLDAQSNRQATERNFSFWNPLLNYKSWGSWN